MSQAYLARQPIFDSQLNVLYYELLYRHMVADTAVIDDDDEATAELLNTAMVEIGLENLTNNRQAFINLSRNYILGKWPVPLDAKRIGLEIAYDMTFDKELLDAVRGLKSKGFTITLDGFEYSPSLDAILKLVDIVKLDVQQLGREGTVAQYRILRRLPLKVAAKKVESKRDFRLFRELGFDYFQGFFFAHPTVVAARKLAPNQINTMQLLAKVQDPGVSVDELEEIISHDVALSVKLLKYINSAFFGLPREFESIRQAIVYLGLKPLKTWVSLIIMSGVEDQPVELMRLSLVRAKMCETLAGTMGDAEPQKYFLAGLFSALDTLLGVPMLKILESLPLSEGVQKALLNREGPIGHVLQCVVDHERGGWDGDTYEEIDPESVTRSYTAAVGWADDALRVVRAL
ncbi:MAG: HDOD domain-containing protein [Pseudomonadota bacterium]|nr:HDOD domain-containing protein [Pseudomonadota bacterium]